MTLSGTVPLPLGLHIVLWLEFLCFAPVAVKNGSRRPMNSGHALTARLLAPRLDLALTRLCSRTILADTGTVPCTVLR
jgi:hypothetical protein